MAFGGGSDDLKITVSVDDKGVITFFDAAGKKQGEFAKAAEDAGRSLDKVDKSVGTSKRSFTELNQALEVGKKVFGLVKSAFSSLLSELERAATLEGVQESFANLQKSIGLTASDSLPALQDATRGLLTDFDLMHAANKAVTMGVETGAGEFNKLSAAAVTLGRAMGQDAKTAIDQITQAIGSGRTQALKLLGVNLDLKNSYEQHAQQLGRNLTEEEKLKIARTEATKAVLEQASKLEQLEDMTLSAGDAAGILKNRYQDARDQFIMGVSTNQDLAKSLFGVADAIAAVDWKTFGQDAVAVFAAVTGVIQDFISGTNELINSMSALGNSASWLKSTLQEGLGRVLFKLNENEVKGFYTKILEVRKEMETGTPEAIAKASRQFLILAEAVNTGGTAMSVLFADELNKLHGELSKAGVGVEGFGKALEAVAPKAERVVQQLGGSAAGGSAGRGLSDAAKQFKTELESLIKSIEKLAVNIDMDLYPKLKDLYQQYKNNTLSAKEYEDQLKEIAKVYATTSEKIQIFTENNEAARKEVDKLAESMEKIDGGAFDQLGDLLSGKLDFGSIGKNIQDGLGSIEQALASGIGNVLTSVFSGGSAREDIANLITGTVTAAFAAVGTALGGPAGGAAFASIGKALSDGFADSWANIGKDKKSTAEGITSIIGAIHLGIPGALGGKVIGKELGKAFWGKHAETAAREGFAKWVKDTIGNFAMIVQGEGIDLGKVFSGHEASESWKEFAARIQGTTDDTAFMSDAFRGFFENLRTDTTEGLAVFEGFLGAGRAMSVLFEDLGLSADQLGTILAKNVGGELNNLQLLFGELGLTQEQFTAALEEAYLSGKIGAGEYIQSLDQVEELYKKGIPNSIGDTDTAYRNFINGALTSGRLAWDSLGDIGHEALEKNIESLDDLSKELIAAGWDVESVDKLMQALSQNGITNVQQLADVTVAQTGRIVESAKALGFPFEAAAEKIDNLNEKLNQLEKDRTVDVYINYIEKNKTEDVKKALSGSGNSNLGTS